MSLFRKSQAFVLPSPVSELEFGTLSHLSGLNYPGSGGAVGTRQWPLEQSHPHWAFKRRKRWLPVRVSDTVQTELTAVARLPRLPFKGPTSAITAAIYWCCPWERLYCLYIYYSSVNNKETGERIFSSYLNMGSSTNEPLPPYYS